MLARTGPLAGRTTRAGEHAWILQEVATMPVYEYACRDCGHDFQVIERISEHEEHEKTPPTCPECMSERVERVLTGAFVKTSKKT